MKLRWALAATAVSLALPAVASANTYCVNKSPCTLGTSMSDIQAALDAAAAHDGLDIVRIGSRPEPYQGPFTYDEPAFNPIQIIGDGPGQTVLAGAPTEPTLALGKAGSKVSKLTLLPKDPGSGQLAAAALELDGADAETVTISYSGSNEGVTGILTHDDAELRDIHVDMSAGLALHATDGPQGTAVYDSVLSSGAAGVLAAKDATATLRDVRVSSQGRAFWAFQSGHIRVTNVLATTASPGAVGADIGDSANLEALHLTLVAPTGGATGIAVDSAAASLDNSIVHGYVRPLLRNNTVPGGEADLSLRFTNVDLNASILSAAGTLDLGPGLRNDDPHFAAPSNFHLRGDSPLIDAGHLTSMSDETDIDGLDRDVDADGDSNGEPDLGAFEYQRSQPIADFAFGPAGAGSRVAYDASASSDPDPGDESGFAYEWAFGDGSSGSGLSPQHSYALPGSYTVVLTVTDPNGLKATAAREMSVGAAPSQPAADAVAPVISGLRVLPRRKRVRFRLSEAARVTLRIVPARSPKRARVLKLSRRAGLSSVRLQRPRALAPGAYRLVLRAVDTAGNRSRPARKRFRLTNP